MEKDKVNKKIRCDVESCIHNDCKENYCQLEQIKISCSCCGDEVSCMDETVCGSFENIKKNES